MNLYVSDLDGTLLNSDQKISEKTKDILNDLIKNNDLKFTIATARTPATTLPILDGVHMNFPAVMMNGVLLYDTVKKEYMEINKFEDEEAQRVIDIFIENKKDFFVYAIKDNELIVYYRNMNKFENDYYNERCNLKLKKFVHIDDYKNEIKDADIINFVTLDIYENLKNISNSIGSIEGITHNFYEDIYGDGNYFMDIYSSKASKANALVSLRNHYPEIERIIAFGDNMNDIPMFESADECYAVENAAKQLKDISTEVIGNNNDDSVAKFIKTMLEKR